MMLLCWSLLSLCLSANAGITALRREPGENVSLQCSLAQCPSSPGELIGMYLYHFSVEKEKELYYYHKSEKFSPRSGYSGRVEKKGSLKNHNITLSNLTVDDAGLYRCVYTYSNTVICNIYILVISGEAPCPRSEKEAPAQDSEKNLPLVLVVAAACSLSIIVTTLFLLLIVPRVKQWSSRRKVRKTPQSSNDYVYEVMTKNGLRPLAAVEQ